MGHALYAAWMERGHSDLGEPEAVSLDGSSSSSVVTNLGAESVEQDTEVKTHKLPAQVKLPGGIVLGENSPKGLIKVSLIGSDSSEDVQLLSMDGLCKAWVLAKLCVHRAFVQHYCVSQCFQGSMADRAAVSRHLANRADASVADSKKMAEAAKHACDGDVLAAAAAKENVGPIREFAARAQDDAERPGSNDKAKADAKNAQQKLTDAKVSAAKAQTRAALSCAAKSKAIEAIAIAKAAALKKAAHKTEADVRAAEAKLDEAKEVAAKDKASADKVAEEKHRAASAVMAQVVAKAAKDAEKANQKSNAGLETVHTTAAAFKQKEVEVKQSRAQDAERKVKIKVRADIDAKTKKTTKKAISTEEEKTHELQTKVAKLKGTLEARTDTKVESDATFKRTTVAKKAEISQQRERISKWKNKSDDIRTAALKSAATSQREAKAAQIAQQQEMILAQQKEANEKAAEQLAAGQKREAEPKAELRRKEDQAKAASEKKLVDARKEMKTLQLDKVTADSAANNFKLIKAAQNEIAKIQASQLEAQKNKIKSVMYASKKAVAVIFKEAALRTSIHQENMEKTTLQVGKWRRKVDHEEQTVTANARRDKESAEKEAHRWIADKIKLAAKGQLVTKSHTEAKGNRSELIVPGGGTDASAPQPGSKS